MGEIENMIATHKDDDPFMYMMLDRFKDDCEYYLGHGNRCAKHLWAVGNPKEHIANMKKLYRNFKLRNKPRWISMRDIRRYERAMLKGKGEHDE